MLGVQAKPFPRPLHLDKMTVWKYIFGKDCVTSPTTKIPGIVSSEAVILVLSVLRTLLNKDVTPLAGPATYIKVSFLFIDTLNNKYFVVGWSLAPPNTHPQLTLAENIYLDFKIKMGLQ